MFIYSPVLALLFTVTATQATTVGYVVDGRSGPWLYLDGGLNTSFQYGVNDQIAPTVVPGLTYGQLVSVAYVSGTVQNSYFSPGYDAAGDLGSPNAAGPENSNGAFPGYFALDPNTTFAYDLIGVFADNSGQLVGAPFAIGNGPGPFAVPAGATRLQLGVNDNLFGDNAGAWNLDVIVAVPEPSAMALLGTGAMLFISRHLRRRPQGVDRSAAAL
jgi:hypothetical protein